MPGCGCDPLCGPRTRAEQEAYIRNKGLTGWGDPVTWPSVSAQGELTPMPKFTQALESIGWIKAILVSEGSDSWKLEQIKHELERCK